MFLILEIFEMKIFAKFLIRNLYLKYLQTFYKQGKKLVEQGCGRSQTWSYSVLELWDLQKPLNPSEPPFLPWASATWAGWEAVIWRGRSEAPACPGQSRSSSSRPHGPETRAYDLWLLQLPVILNPQLPARLRVDVGERKGNLWGQGDPEGSGQKSKLSRVNCRCPIITKQGVTDRHA